MARASSRALLEARQSSSISYPPSIMALASIACNLDKNMLLASLPLFESEQVQALEWSFDALFKVKQVPDWFHELLIAYGNEGRLVGHGVYFSIFFGKWLPAQAEWLNQLKRYAATYRFDHITEHFGFMTGEDFHKGAPLGVPMTESTLALGIDRLKRIQDAADCPVGLENLAFAYSLDEVKKQGEFLSRLIEPINGFIILDLHNLFCQLHNFGVGFEEMLALYPLERVREIHVSGGSWEESAWSPDKKIRRDTHDDTVPATVFELLERTMPQCPRLKFVVMEQLGTALDTAEQRQHFQEDFYKMNDIVQRHPSESGQTPYPFLPIDKSIATVPVEDHQLAKEQNQLSMILENALDYDDARQWLSDSMLANSAWEVEKWEPAMLDTAIAIAKKWQHGFK